MIKKFKNQMNRTVRRKIIVSLLIVIIFVSFTVICAPVVAAQPTEIPVIYPEKLQEKCDGNNIFIRLEADMLAKDLKLPSNTLYINGDRVDIDLNGHLLECSIVIRDKAIYDEKGKLISYNGGDLTIKDSKPNNQNRLKGTITYTDPTTSQNNNVISGGVITGSITVNPGCTLHLVSGTIANGNGIHISGPLLNEREVHIQDGASFVMDGGFVVGHRNTGIYVADGGKFTLNGGVISCNSGNNGGGVYVFDNFFTMNGGTISRNSASNGGGIYIAKNNEKKTAFDDKYQSGLILKGGKISENKATGYGGGLYTKEKDVSLSGIEISQNSAQYGGGIANIGARISLSSKSILSENSASDGSEIYISRGRCALNYVIISGTEKNCISLTEFSEMVFGGDNLHGNPIQLYGTISLSIGSRISASNTYRGNPFDNYQLQYWKSSKGDIIDTTTKTWSYTIESTDNNIMLCPVWEGGIEYIPKAKSDTSGWTGITTTSSFPLISILCGLGVILVGLRRKL